MSHNPPHGSYGAPPPYYGYGTPPPPPPPGGYAYVPAPVMMPMPMYQPPPPPPPAPVPEQIAQPQPTYVTNYIYQQPTQSDPVRVVEDSLASRVVAAAGLVMDGVSKIARKPDPGTVVYQPIVVGGTVSDPIEWVGASTANVSTLAHRAYVAGKEGWDGSPLCVIRAHHSGEFIPGKLAIKHRSAYVPHGGKEVPVHNFEVLCCPPHTVRFLPASNGQVPVGAIPAGNTHHGETLYIARVKHLRSITPGKVHPSHGCCYISFGGNEISYKSYEVLCKIVG